MTSGSRSEGFQDHIGRKVVRAVGLEPTLLAEPDFEFPNQCYDHLRQNALKLE